MLIEKDAYIISRNDGVFLCWSFLTKNGGTRTAEEKLTYQTLNDSKIIYQGGQLPVIAIREKKQDSYKVVDLLPASLPLNQSLHLEVIERETSNIKIALRSASEKWELSLRPSDSFCKHLWLFETGIPVSIKILKGRDKFRLSLIDSDIPKSLSGILFNFTKTKYGFDAWLMNSVNGEPTFVRCTLAQQLFWAHSIDTFSDPENATLSSTVSWSEKYKQYQVSHIEQLLNPGNHRFELISVNTKDDRQYLKLASEYSHLEGIQFSAFYPPYAPLIESFKRCSTTPLYLNVNVFKDGDNLKFNLVNFEVPPDLSLTGTLSAVSNDEEGKRDQPIYRVDVQGLGRATLTMLSKFQIPADIELISTSSQRKIPITFSPDKLRLLPGISRESGTIMTGIFCSGGFSELLPDYALFSQKEMPNTFAFRVHMKELHRFGLASVEKGKQIELTLTSCHSPSIKGLEWNITEIHKMEDLLEDLTLPNTLANREAHILRNWSAIQPSPATELCDLTSLYYQGGALSSVSLGSTVCFLLPLSASLLSEKGIFNLEEGEQLSTSFEIRLDHEAQRYFLSCTDLDETRIPRIPATYSELRFIGTDKKKENTLIFSVTKAGSGNPCVGSQISYKLKKEERIPFTLILMQDDARFTVVTRQFRGKHYIKQFVRVDIR